MNRVIGALLCGVIGFAGCTVEVSTKAESPTRVAVGSKFRPFTIIGNDTLQALTFYGIDVGDVHFDSLHSNDTTEYVEIDFDDSVAVAIDSVVGLIHKLNPNGGILGTAPITIYDIKSFHIGLVEHNRNVVALDSSRLNMGDWLQGTRVSVYNKMQGITLSSGARIISGNLYGVRVANALIGDIAAGDSIDYVSISSNNPVAITMDSMEIVWQSCLTPTRCNEVTDIITDIDTVKYDVLLYRKNRIVFDENSKVLHGALGLAKRQR